jgi:uncharacterized protein (TIGR02466 family)
MPAQVNQAQAATVFELFPTPVLHVPGLLTAADAQALAQRLALRAAVPNSGSDKLAHTQPLAPGDDAGVDALVSLIGPHVQHLGQLLFGQTLPWLVNHVWANVLQTGGQQALHNHANCFVSGIVYLTEPDASARTVFARPLGGADFVFRNDHAGSQANAFNAAKWIVPAPQVGDLLLFPSYLLHEVPRNLGGERVSVAFNAITQRLDSWGYSVSFQP